MGVFGNDPVWSAIEWGDDLGDYQQIVEENDFNKQQKLDLLTKLTKATFGARQSEKNEGYGMGWNTDGEGPPTVYDNEKVDHIPYLDVYSDLSAFDHTTLSEDEIEQLESKGLDMADYGFNESVEGPQLPVIDGERFPLVVEEGDEVEKALRLLNSIDWDEVTYCPKDGSLQGTPSLGPSEEGDIEVNTDKVAESNTGGNTEVNLAENPEAISEVNVSDIRSEVTDITSLRSLKTMLRAEREGKNRSSAISRLEERISAVGDSSDDEDSISDAEEEMVETLIETGRVEDREEGIEMVRNL